MRRVGNVSSNRLYNPTNAKASIPLDIDEVDSAMEKYIRQKYQQRLLQGTAPRPSIRHDTGSSSSEEPPPLPPKPEQRFGFNQRAVSSTFPLSARARQEHEAGSASLNPRSQQRQGPLPSPKSKPSQVFGASLGGSGGSVESKLTRLKEMGFADETRNATILISSDGSLERAVEKMVAMGERSVAPSNRQFPGSSGPESNNVPGRSASMSIAEPSSSNNPFNAATVQAPQVAGGSSRQETYLLHDTSQGNQAPVVTQDPFSIHFDAQIPHAQPLPQSFEALHLSNRLFPHSTGDVPTHRHEAMFQRQAQTPPVPSLPPLHDHSGP